MRWLVALSLRNRIVVVALAVLLVVAAARTLRTTPLDVFPEFAPPLVEVQTEAPGLSTNEVESLVTVPLEAALNGIPGLDRIRSKSVLGLSSVVLILDPTSDVMTARQMVHPRQMDDPPAADGDSRRGECGDLGSTRSAAPGPH